MNTLNTKEVMATVKESIQRADNGELITILAADTLGEAKVMRLGQGDGSGKHDVITVSVKEFEYIESVIHNLVHEHNTKQLNA